MFGAKWLKIAGRKRPNCIQKTEDINNETEEKGEDYLNAGVHQRAQERTREEN